MRTRIDHAGRVVIPAEIRKRLRLRAGTVLRVEGDDLGFRLLRNVPGPELVRRGERLVVEPRVPEEERPEIDSSKLVEEERERCVAPSALTSSGPGTGSGSTDGSA